MFSHTKTLMTPVEVTQPDPRFAQHMLEQFGGAAGELTAALQYWAQSFHVENSGIRDMLQDIAVEEFSHLEVVGMLIQQHSAGAVEERPGAPPSLPCAAWGRICSIHAAMPGRRPM